MDVQRFVEFLHSSAASEGMRQAWEARNGQSFPGRWCGIEPVCESQVGLNMPHSGEDRNLWVSRWLALLTAGSAVKGVEIGACAMPVDVPPHATMTYVDRDADDTKAACGYARDRRRVTVTDDAQHLTKLAARSRSFLVANHVLEHMQDFLGAIASWLRVLRIGGLLFASVPDMCDPDWLTGERFRLATKPSHFLDEYRNGSTAEHNDEGAIMLLGMVQNNMGWNSFETNALRRAEAELRDKPYLTHRHTFTHATLRRALKQATGMLGFRVLELHTARRGPYNMQEHRIVLQRTRGLQAPDLAPRIE